VHPRPPGPGLLVSVEGVSGTGKTYLANRLLSDNPGIAAGAVVINEFSRRPPGGDLGHDLLHTLIDAAAGDPLLRGGHPAAETLMLLAIKAHDYEAHCLPALAQGRIVLEGRSLHCVAVYQALILHPDDDGQAFAEMLTILNTAAQWRPLPDLTFLVTDDPAEAAGRAGQRDGRPFSTEYRHVHHRAAALYDQAAGHAPGNIVVIDRRQLSTSGAIRLMRTRITECQQAPTVR
jgi:dTMP kinase